MRRRRGGPALVAMLCWLAHGSYACETGVAHVASVLSVPRSLLANADVALLQEYSTDSLARCMEECCTGKYGSCTIASFKKSSTKKNCMHFNCRPLNKCKFLSSNSTDTFSFSSQPPAKHHQKTTPTTKKDTATFPDEQLALKNDNTTVKPRKGVEEDMPVETSHPKSGVKPRKGVSTLDVPHSELLPASVAKSNVKPRKGVPTDPTQVPPTPVIETQKPHLVDDSTKDLMSELENVFADEVSSANVEPTSTNAWTSRMDATVSPTESASTTNQSDSMASHITLASSYATETIHIVPSSTTKTLSNPGAMTRQFVSAAVEEIIVPFSSAPTSDLSISTAVIQPSKASTLTEGSKQQSPLKDFNQTSRQPLLSQKELDAKLKQSTSLQQNHSLLLEDGLQRNSSRLVSIFGHKTVLEEEQKYRSSIHLVLSLVFGLLVLFAVLGVVAKRVYDGWLRRDYHRMNYLIDGIYDGVD